MKYPRNAKIFRGQLDSAPLAGVFFLLVLFIMLSSRLVFIPGARIQLPEVSGLPMAGVEGPTAVVAMDAGGQLFFENQAIQEKELGARLRQAVTRNQDLTLIVQADKTVTIEAFNRINTLANRAGVRQILLASRIPSEP